MAEKKMRWSDKELSIIKTSFAGQEDLMVLFRKYILQGDMSKEELGLLNRFSSSPEIIAVLKKSLNPTIDKLAPPFQTVDVFSAVDFKPIPYDHAYLVIKGWELVSQFLTQRFINLEGKTTRKEIKFDELSIPTEDKEQTYINLSARNNLLAHIDYQLFNGLMTIAGEKTETPEEQKKRLQQDSSK